MGLPPARQRNVASLVADVNTPQTSTANISAALRGIGMTAEDSMVRGAVEDRMDFIKRELKKNPQANIGDLMGTPTPLSEKSQARFMELVAQNAQTDIRAQLLGVANRGRAAMMKAQNHESRDAAGRNALTELKQVYEKLPAVARRLVANNYLSGLQTLSAANENAREQIQREQTALANSNLLREIRSSVNDGIQNGDIQAITSALADGVEQTGRLAKKDLGMARLFGEQVDSIRSHIRNNVLNNNDALAVFFEGLDPLTQHAEIKKRFGVLAAAGGLMHFDAALEKYEKHAVGKFIVEQEFGGIIGGEWYPGAEAHRGRMTRAANRARGIAKQVAESRGWNVAALEAAVGDEARAQTSHISPVKAEKKNRNRGYIAEFSLANGEYMEKLLNGVQQGQKPDGALMSSGPAPKWSGNMTESDLNDLGDIFSDRTGLLKAWGINVNEEAAFDEYTIGLGKDDKSYLRERALHKQNGMVWRKRNEYSDEIADVENLQDFLRLPLKFGGDQMEFVFPEGAIGENGELIPSIKAALYEAGKAIDAEDPGRRETYARILRARSPATIGSLAARVFRESFAPRRDAQTVAANDLAALNIAPGRADVSAVEIQNAPFDVRVMSGGGRGSSAYPAMVSALLGQFPENKAKVPVGGMGVFRGADPNEVHREMATAPVAVLAPSGKFDRWRTDNKYAAPIVEYDPSLSEVDPEYYNEAAKRGFFQRNALSQRIEESGAFGPGARWSILIQKEQGRTMWILAPTNEHGEPLAWDAYDGARLGYVLRQAR